MVRQRAQPRRRALALCVGLAFAGAIAQTPTSRDPGRPIHPLQQFVGSADVIVQGEGAIRVASDETWRAEAARALAIAEQTLAPLAEQIGADVAEVLPIWIVISLSEKNLGPEAPGWSAAIARPARQLIVISGPALRGARMNLHETVMHELVHLLVYARIGTEAWIPHWMHEGLAVHESQYERFGDRFVFWGRGPIHLSELTMRFPSQGSRARLAYVESGAAVRRLGQLGSMQLFFDRIRDGQEYEQAFLSEFGLSPQAFADVIHEEVDSRWRYISMFANSGMLFGSLAVLFVFGGVVRLMRNRRRMQQWEHEEKQAERRIELLAPRPAADPGSAKPPGTTPPGV